jgi:replicative DNA helicase
MIRATADHRLLTGSGWCRLEALATGDRLAIARRLPEPMFPDEWPDRRVALLGQLIGDGSYLVNQPLRYTTSSEENSRLVREAAVSEFGAQVKRYRGRASWHQLMLAGNGNRWHPSGVNAWLRSLGIFGQRSYEKRVPEGAFALSNRQVAVLLRHLWATDGTIAPRHASRGSARVAYATNSPGLAADVAALLLRLGIVARISSTTKAGYRRSFFVAVSGAPDQRRFLDIVGAFGPRQAAARRLARVLSSQHANTNVDTLPVEDFARVKTLMRERGLTQRGMAAIRATSDLFWDRIVAIEPNGVEEVFDLTVPGPACWLADGIVSHNSGALEQDSDLILFLYRQSVYKEDLPPDEANIAEVIIGKQRNGPIGTVKVVFLPQYARFENIADRHRQGAF